MDGYGPGTYGERWAQLYDERVGEGVDRQATVDTLAELAAGGRVLELAIGTGRVALPLADRGVTVAGIDASPAMIARLRAKPGGEAIPVTTGDFADVAVDGCYALVYVVFNTFFALLTQDDQLRCFRNVAGRLTAEGLFVLEAFVPEPARFADGQTVRALRVDLDAVDLEASRHDPLTQTVTSQHIVLTEGATRLLPVTIRYAWPSELDLMARLAGLHLRHRWADWRRRPFTAASRAHVSVYGRG